MASFEIENNLLKQGFKNICGIDEVGRGAIFGPVVAGAVIMNPGELNQNINDSKKLSKKMRIRLSRYIYSKAIAYSTGWAWHDEIDSLGIVKATKIAVKMAVMNLQIKPGYVLIDAMESDFLSIAGESIIKGDEKSISIAAASIVAKVFRDNLIVNFSKYFPEYSLDKNKGYLTRDHYQAVRTYGRSVFHRESFRVEKWRTNA